MIELPSVRFDTDFEPERPRFRAPLTIASGHHAAIAVVDGFRRGDKIVGRFDTGPGLIALAVAGDGRPVEVTLTLTADRRTPEWSDRSLANDSSEPHAPRLILVRSQGRTRGIVLLGRRHDEFAFASRATVRFRIDGAEITDDGLLVIELADGALDPEYGHAPHAASGVRIDTIRVVPVNDGAAGTTPAVPRTGTELVEAGLVSTGLPPRSGRAALAGDSFAVMPGIGSWRLRGLRVRPVPPDEMLPNPGPPWPRQSTGEPPLRMREKAIRLVKHKARRVLRGVHRRAGHAVSRSIRLADPAIGWLRTLSLRHAVRRGRLRAEVVPVNIGRSSPSQPCRLAYVGRRTVVVTATAPVTGESIVRLVGPAGSFRYAWHLIDGQAL